MATKPQRNAWKPEEIRVLDDHYATLGPNGCMPLLRGRTRTAIQVYAHGLGLHVAREVGVRAGDRQKVERITGTHVALPQLSGLDGLILGWTQRREGLRA